MRQNTEWVSPVLFLFVLVFAFGLMIPNLGFYWDDWPPILIEKMQESQTFWEFYRYDRPFSAWTYVVLFPILGIKPLTWQIFTLALRWLTTVFAWLTWRELWPTHRRQAVWAAIIFALYPTFDQQAISVAFSQHWICYLFYVASLWAMIKAVRMNSSSYALLSYALAGVHLWTMEYFSGLELLRPLVLLILSAETEGHWGQRLRFMAKKWWPYLLIFSAFVYWRMFLLEFPGEDPNQIVIFSQLREDPITALWQFFELAFQDTVYTLFGVWNQTVSGQAIELDSPFFRIVIGVSILSTGLTWYALTFLRREKSAVHPEPGFKWEYQAMSLGLIALMLGAFPAWMAGREITASFFSSRFSLASMFGAGLFFVGLLEWITPRYFVKIVLISIMVMVTTNYHLRTKDIYRDSWDWQRKFYWQLYWRAPYIEPGTPLISDNEVLVYAGGYATAMGLNLLYNEGAQPDNLPYWFLVLDDRLDGQMFQFRNRHPLEGGLRNLSFTGESNHSLIINYNGRSCLHVLADGRAENTLLTPALQQIITVSNLNRIQPETEGLSPDPDIFGPEPDHTWCYYYQKADLARQLENWEQVTRLGDMAIEAGYSPFDPIEWFVFIEGYGLTGQVEAASSLTQKVFSAREDYAPALCELWQDMATQYNVNAQVLDEWDSLQRELSCQSE